MKRKILKPHIIAILFITLFSLISVPCFAIPRHRTLSTVGVVIKRENNGITEILLQKRKNTDWMDGCWDLGAGGHVENNETLRQAAKREINEELGLDVDVDNLTFVGLDHNNIAEKGIYYCVYFEVKDFSGIPTVGEPDKCEAIEWFPIDDLPQNIIPIRKMFIENLGNTFYNEYGWDESAAKTAHISEGKSI